MTADGEILIIQYVLKPHVRPAKWGRTLWLNTSLNLNQRMCLLKRAGVLRSARFTSGRCNTINTPGSHNNLLARLNEIRRRGFQLCGRQPDKCIIQRLRLRSYIIYEKKGGVREIQIFLLICSHAGVVTRKNQVSWFYRVAFRLFMTCSNLFHLLFSPDTTLAFFSHKFINQTKNLSVKNNCS